MNASELEWKLGGGEGSPTNSFWEYSQTLTDGKNLWIAIRRVRMGTRYMIRDPGQDIRVRKVLWEGHDDSDILLLMCAIEHYGLRLAHHD